MAKKKLTADEAVEVATLEANIEAQEAAEIAASPADPTPIEAADPDTIDKGEVIGDSHEQTILVDGQVYHHIRETADGRWIYAAMKPK